MTTLYKLVRKCLKKEVNVDKATFAFVCSFLFLGYSVAKFLYAIYIHNSTNVKTTMYKWFELYEEIEGAYIAPITFTAGDAFIIFMGLGFLLLFIKESGE